MGLLQPAVQFCAFSSFKGLWYHVHRLPDSDSSHTYSAPALRSECPFAVFSLFPYCSRQFQVSGAVVDVCGCAHTYSPSTRMAERGGANRACWSTSLVEYTNSGPMRNCVSETRRVTGQDTHSYPNTSTQGNRIHLSVVSLGVQET